MPVHFTIEGAVITGISTSIESPCQIDKIPNVVLKRTITVTPPACNRRLRTSHNTHTHINQSPKKIK
jgi:hypothetical protein